VAAAGTAGALAVDAVPAPAGGTREPARVGAHENSSAPHRGPTQTGLSPNRRTPAIPSCVVPASWSPPLCSTLYFFYPVQCRDSLLIRVYILLHVQIIK